MNELFEKNLTGITSGPIMPLDGPKTIITLITGKLQKVFITRRVEKEATRPDGK